MSTRIYVAVQMHNVNLQFARKWHSYGFWFFDMVADLFDELVKLWAVPVVLNVSGWLTEVDVEQLSKDQTHRSFGRPRHRLHQQWYNRLLYRIRQTHLSPVNRSKFTINHILYVWKRSITARKK